MTGRTNQAVAAPLSSSGSDETDGPSFDFLSDALQWRAANRADDILYTQVDSRVSSNCYYYAYNTWT